MALFQALTCADKDPMAQPDFLDPPQILAAVARYFDQPVLKLTAPGGRSRTSFRAWFADHTIIVSQRHASAQADVERRVLTALQSQTDAVPRHLGSDGTLTFQSDVGINRLSLVIHTTPAPLRPRLAEQALAAIFDIHRAARRAGLGRDLPVAGFRPTPDDDLTEVAGRAVRQLSLPDPGFDPARLSPLFRRPPCRFVKWDCRAGNAALGADGQLRWFDFEDARLAQGPEDFAWLIADETWPLPAEVMLDQIGALLQPQDTDNAEDYLTYLAEYATLHALRRLRLIVSEARHRGWLELGQILKFDRVGANPHLAERLSLRGAVLARRNPSTLPLVPVFDEMAKVFRKVRQPPQASRAPQS